MLPLGHKQPFNIISGEWLLLVSPPRQELTVLVRLANVPLTPL